MTLELGPGNEEEALDNINELRQMKDKLNLRPRDSIAALNYYATILLRLEAFGEAEQTFQQQLEISQQISNREGIVEAMVNLSVLFLLSMCNRIISMIT